MGQPVTITLTVNDAEGLYNNWNNPKLDVTSYCTLKDNSDKTPLGSGAEFTSYVHFNENVTWESEVKTPPARTPYNAGIDMIMFEPGKNRVDFFLDRENDITGKISTNKQAINSKVTAQVNSRDAIGEGIDVYTIYFTVYPPFQAEGRQFHIDPKLQGHN